MTNDLKKFNIKKEILPAGGWSNVFVAEYNQKIVALKILKKEHAKNAKFVKDFFSEAETLKKFNNPNIARILDIGDKLSPPYYFALEYYSKGNLNSYIKKKKTLSNEEILEISLQICKALDSIHREGDLHLDLKPSNILFGKHNRVVLTDFGSSKNLLSASKDGVRTGTPQYMSPEQFDLEHELTFSSDLYSLGVIMYYMASGQLPFSGNDFRQLEILHSTVKPFPISDFNKNIDTRLEKIIFTLLEKKPENRISTAKVVSEKIQNLQFNSSKPLTGLQIALYDKFGNITKTKKYYKFPITISRKKESKSNFSIYDKNASIEHARIIFENGLFIYSDNSRIGSKLNDQVVVNAKVPIDSKVSFLRIGNTKLRISKIESSPIKQNFKFLMFFLVVILFFSSLYALFLNVEDDDRPNIISFSLSSTSIFPEEEFDFNFNTNNISIIKSVEIAPFGREDKKFLRPPQKRVYSYDYESLQRENEKKFNFEIRVEDVEGRFSDWIGQQITVKSFSNDIILSSFSLNSSNFIEGDKIPIVFDISTELEMGQIVVELTILKNNNIVDYYSKQYLEWKKNNTITIMEKGQYKLKLVALDKNNSSTISKPFIQRLTINSKIPPPSISFNSKLTKRALTIAYNWNDALYTSNDSVTISLFVNNRKVEYETKAEGVIAYRVPQLDWYNHYLQIKTDDGRIKRSSVHRLNNLPKPTIKFNRRPIINSNNRIRLEFSHSVPNEKIESIKLELIGSSTTFSVPIASGNNIALIQLTNIPSGNYSVNIVIKTTDKLIGRTSNNYQIRVN